MSTQNIPTSDAILGCIYGLMCGDALGGSVEFLSADEIKKLFPAGVRDMVNGQGHSTMVTSRKPGNITDDSEMALALMQGLITAGHCDDKAIHAEYLKWLNSNPPDVGYTTYNGIKGDHVKNSQSNGGLMRVAPLACWLATHPQEDRNTAIAEECALTHVNPVCVDSNLVYVNTIIDILTNPTLTPGQLFNKACQRAIKMHLSPDVNDCLALAQTEEPNYERHIGWVLIALRAAYYHLLNTKNFEEALIRVVSAGGDTDTNGAICGGLLGAFYGLKNIPARWIDAVHQTQPWLKEKVDAFHRVCQ